MIEVTVFRARWPNRAQTRRRRDRHRQGRSRPPRRLPLRTDRPDHHRAVAHRGAVPAVAPEVAVHIAQQLKIHRLKGSPRSPRFDRADRHGQGKVSRSPNKFGSISTVPWRADGVRPRSRRSDVKFDVADVTRKLTCPWAERIGRIQRQQTRRGLGRREDMSIDIVTNDAVALADSDLDEMASMGGPSTSVPSPRPRRTRSSPRWPASRQAARLQLLDLERIGGTPCVLIGMMSVRRHSSAIRCCAA